MDEFIARQRTQIRYRIADFRHGALSLNSVIQQIEGLAQTIGEPFWADQVFPLVVELEGINSELIDKRRDMTLAEREKVETLLKGVEALINE